jgi:hypothetical protein
MARTAALTDQPQRRELLGAAMLLGLGTALGSTTRALAQGVTSAPQEVSAALGATRLQGRATMRFFGLRIYQARLWVDAQFQPERYQTHRFALELQYARTLSGADIAERSLQEMRRAGGVDEARAQNWLAAMSQSFPDVAEGDRLTGLHEPGGATRFFMNGRNLALIADPTFGAPFFGIWLSPSTSEPRLREQLLGSTT